MAREEVVSNVNERLISLVDDRMGAQASSERGFTQGLGVCTRLLDLSC